MKHELKVILGATPHQTLVLIDDEPVGLIQEIKFHVKAGGTDTDIEIVFPNFLEHKETNKVFATQLEQTLELLKELPHVRVLLKPIW
jgi:hypothetical protein